MSIKQAYAPIDIHKSKAEAWPDVMPKLTEAAAINAVTRLYRFSMGKPMQRDVYITSGNRRPVRFGWTARTATSHAQHPAVWINPEQGWKDLIHSLSHWLDYLANGESTHGKHHARFEAKLVREVIRRGWLDEKPAAPAPVVVPINNTEAKRRLALSRIEARIVNWQRKQKRAENALKKLRVQQRYYVKALGGGK